MGNRIGRLKLCFTCDYSGDNSLRRQEISVCSQELLESDDEYSFFYPPQESPDGAAAAAAEEFQFKNITFASISGATVSANAFTSSVYTPPISVYPSSSSCESSDSLADVPFQPINRRHSFHSGRVSEDSGAVSVMGLVERGFLSGPLPSLDPFDILSEPIPKKRSLIGDIKKTIANSIILPIRAEKKSDWDDESFNGKIDDTFLGKAGEDRVHVVVSEENKWAFVGIYDGFNGPDATDFLHNNLYSNVYKEIKWLLNSSNDPKVDVKSKNVLKSLSEGLRKTESTFFQISDMMLKEHPELCLMGSCVLVMVMKSEDIYLMNVGDSRAVLARDEREKMNLDDDFNLSAIQMTMDHNTSVEEEVKRIKEEHKDDAFVILKGRVKGSLKITRAFGAGFLKKPKWNNALIEPFRKEYIGSSPYINCMPNLIHHKLCSRDKFLILSSDGLYQYFTNEDAVNEVGKFLSSFPDGDPARHLVQQVLQRAATKAGMKLHELLDIPQGDGLDGFRRKYHDDVSVIVISFQGMIWKSAI
ncbi:probable protein phosphatase 2C 23 [Impatiens glandulifera]|uniref:probable protein phosphatase 2C 23 n=1 Tax=Impatiens glandulifera TaxID=253017 RepID=UPI001FB04D98|nr:probable protein phosphatase 2C 23 [Impatiens glandulifera]